MKRYPSLRAYLKGEGRTQEQLAADLGLRQGTVNKWVNGDRMPRAEMALKLSKLTGVPVEAMLRAKSQKAAA